jgi:large-conductance mechanosensitive channel
LKKIKNILKTEKNKVPQNPTMKTRKHKEDFSKGIRASESDSSVNYRLQIQAVFDFFLGGVMIFIPLFLKNTNPGRREYTWSIGKPPQALTIEIENKF